MECIDKFILSYEKEQKRRYIQSFGFETKLSFQQEVLVQGIAVDYQTVELCAIAVNLGHTNSKVFDSVWRQECSVCSGVGICNLPGGYVPDIRKFECKTCCGTGYIEPYDLMITFCRHKDKIWNVSLYSTKEHINCEAIAKSFGGNGHKEAAEFQCKELPFEY